MRRVYLLTIETEEDQEYSGLIGIDNGEISSVVGMLGDMSFRDVTHHPYKEPEVAEPSEEEREDYIGTRHEVIQRTGRTTNKCEDCGKNYKYPNYVFAPRDKICFTCECKRGKIKVLTEALLKVERGEL